MIEGVISHYKIIEKLGEGGMFSSQTLLLLFTLVTCSSTTTFNLISLLPGVI
jgi:hypothetical protein